VSHGRAVYYRDNSGVSVATGVVEAEQPLSRRTAVSMRALADRIVIERKPLDPGDPGANGQPTGHPAHDPDAVTSASATAAGGAVQKETRIEGIVGARHDLPSIDRPVSVALSVRGSREPDYRSLSGALSGRVDLAQQNVTLAAFLGAGYDDVLPVEDPPGQEDLWPAEHHRITSGVSAAQVLSPTLLLSVAVAATFQRGQLANPYRRALVRTSLFPEVVPSARDRYTGFAALSWYLGCGTALHLRQGVYDDSWGVLALIPEAALAAELFGDHVLTSLRYRFYRQWRADFYRARYQDLEPILTGDVRLGPIVDHTVGGEVRYTLGGVERDLGSWTFVASYELSLTDYLDYATSVIVGQVGQLGVQYAY